MNIPTRASLDVEAIPYTGWPPHANHLMATGYVGDYINSRPGRPWIRIHFAAHIGTLRHIHLRLFLENAVASDYPYPVIICHPDTYERSLTHLTTQNIIENTHMVWSWYTVDNGRVPIYVFRNIPRDTILVCISDDIYPLTTDPNLL